MLRKTSDSNIPTFRKRVSITGEIFVDFPIWIFEFQTFMFEIERIKLEI